MSLKPKAIALSGDGINCDAETVWALNLAGFDAKAVHTHELLQDKSLLNSVQLLALPGGFSFGDEIASGKVLAVKLKDRMSESLRKFVDDGKLIIGICNGFQVLVQLGLLPNSEVDKPKLVSLLRNNHGHFVDRWVKMKVTKGASKFFSGLNEIELPVRHGEGRIALQAGITNEASETFVKQQGQLRYVDDINGSFDQIAALTNVQDTVLGMMPHPEAFIRWTQHPGWLNRRRSVRSTDSSVAIAEMPHGLAILSNAAQALN